MGKERLERLTTGQIASDPLPSFDTVESETALRTLTLTQTGFGFWGKECIYL